MSQKIPEEVLIAQAEFLEYPPEAYISSSPEEREIIKEMHRKEYFQRACKKGTVPTAEAKARTAEHMEQLPMGEQQLTKTNSAAIRQKASKRAKSPEVIESPDDDYQLQEDSEGKAVKVYHNQATVPNPVRPDERDGPTVGTIRERVPAPIDDLVGDRPPRTLLDLYARWPLADDSDFFLRIERTLPKRYQGVVTTGLVGEIRGQRVTEADIQRMYGGQEYKVTLYGPDPRKRGAVEADGSPRVKALTDPITITVPVLPPNLRALPYNQENMNQNPMNPFGPTSAVPTTAGDAAVVKAHAGFFADALKMQANESQRRESESSKSTSSLLSFMSETSKSQLQQLKEEAQRREDEKEKQISELKAQVEREKAAQGEVASRVAAEKDKSNQGLVELYKTMGPDKQLEIQRLSEHYREQSEILRRAHADQLQSIQSRHEGDLRRADERLKDTESNYRQILEQERSQSRQMLEQERSQWSQREQDLRAQMERQTENERKLTQQRIDDMKERHASEIRQMEKSHERELRGIKEAEGMKYSVSEQTHAMALMHVQERLSDAKEEVERAREEAADAKDLSKQLEQMERQAELLGFEKKDANEPKGPWERFAATAGAGLSQVMSTANEWLPAAMAARQQAIATRALPPPQPQQQRPIPRPPMTAQQQQQQAAAQQRRRTSGAEWAAEGVQVRPTPQPEPGFRQSASEPSSEMRQPQEAPAKIQETPVQEQPDESSNGAAVLQVQFPEKFLQFFPPEALMGFLQQAEQAINTQVEPAGFAALMANSSYSEGASALVGNFEASEVWEAVGAIPGAESSPLLRRDGKRWMERLFKELKRELASKVPSSETAAQ